MNRRHIFKKLQRLLYCHIKHIADYIIDMGPEGGDGGGKVIAKGTPEQVAEAEGSYTGKYVKKYLQK